PRSANSTTTIAVRPMPNIWLATGPTASLGRKQNRQGYVTDLSSVTSETPSGDGDPFYVFKASLAGAPFALWLRRDGIEWNLGRRSGLLRYDKIRRIRLAYRPATMQSHRFTTEIWSDDLPKFQIVS